MTFNDLLPWGHPSNINIRQGKNPFASLQNEVNKLFEGFGGDWNVPSLWSSDNKNISPAIDIIENDKSFKVEAELPGIKQENVEVDINDSYLNIKAEKKSSKNDDGDNYVRRERFYGTYQRTISLPETADASKAKASFKKGVLWVEIPKKAEAVAKSRKLEVREAA